MASPIAASAPATVKTKIANIWPVKSPKYEEKVTKFIFTDNNIISIDMSIEMIFLRFKKIPATPMPNKIIDKVTKC